MAILCVLLLVLLVVLPPATESFPRHGDALLHRMRGLSQARPGQLQGAHAARGRPVHGHSHGGLPMYMMQLYRTLLADDRAAHAALSRTKSEDNPHLHHADSVVNLVADRK